MAEKKYIELATLFKTVEDYASTHPVMRDNELFALFCSVPAADVQPVVRGKWEYDHWCEFKCSNCGAWSKSEPYRGRENFCPNCGAMMEKR